LGRAKNSVGGAGVISILKSLEMEMNMVYSDCQNDAVASWMYA